MCIRFNQIQPFFVPNHAFFCTELKYTYFISIIPFIIIYYNENCPVKKLDILYFMIWGLNITNKCNVIYPKAYIKYYK